MATQRSFSRNALADALRDFAGRHGVRARLYDGDADLGVTLTFESPNRMLIAGLRPELPPELLFSSAGVAAGMPNASNEDRTGDPGVEVFRIFDPRAFTEIVEGYRERVIETGPGWLELQYHLGEVIPMFNALKETPLVYTVAARDRQVQRLLPPEIREWVNTLVYEPRTVAFHLVDGRIAEAVHQDLPPDDDLITLRFFYA